MNWNQMQTDWKNVREQAHSRWAKLTDADLNAIGGKRDELISRLRQRYAFDATKAEEEAEDFREKARRNER